jgi:hypothetical protein
MTPIANDGFQAICGNCDCSGFIGHVNWSFNSGTSVLTVTDGSTFPSGDGMGAVIIKVSDGQGHVKEGRIAVAAGNTTFDLSTGGFVLGPQGFNILATVSTIARCTADLGGYGISATTTGAGTLGFVDQEPSPGIEVS